VLIEEKNQQKTDAPYLLKVVKPTTFKTEAIQSAELPEDKKFIIEEVPQEFPMLAYKYENQHYKITLADKTIKGFNTWFAYDGHVELRDRTGKLIQKALSLPKSNNPAVQRQIERLTKYLSAGMTLNLGKKTKYFSQHDNYTMSHRTCCSSSNAMYLNWLLEVTGKAGFDNDDGYLKKVLANGDTTRHDIQTKTIAEYGFKTKWMTDADLDFVEDLVDTGFPVVVNILHRGSTVTPRGGHIILLIGKKSDEWIAHDPYGTLESNYSVTDGKFSQIAQKEFSARWQGGYRILS
jgi:hypothetical protein